MELILGGAALGNVYGVFGGKEVQSGAAAFSAFLGSDEEHGFTAIDTAPGYGASEQVIGSSGWSGSVHTKLSRNESPLESVKQSLARLQRDVVDVLYLFHEPKEWLRKSAEEFRGYSDCLVPYAQNIGASVYEPHEFSHFAAMESISVVQIPMNVFDRRFRNVLEHSRRAEVKTYARSIFLQGLLIDAGGHERFNLLRPYFEHFFRLARESELNPISMAAGWVMAQKAVDGVVVGVQNYSQFQEVLMSLRDLPLSSEVLAALEDLPQPPSFLVDPRNWR